MSRCTRRRRAAPVRTLAAVALAALLAACGGGDDRSVEDGPASCSVADQKAWLRQYMAERYFWWRDSPSPEPAGYATLQSYFNALLYRGSNPAFPDADRWSYLQSDADFDRFYNQGQSMGYGLFVAGLEVQGQPAQPLYVRMVEPQSPAALAGVARGDRIVSANGRSAADMIAANDFSVLTAVNAGDRLTLVLRDPAGMERTAVLTADAFALTPVPVARTLTTADGRRMGYVMVKDMIGQTGAGLNAAFTQFKAAGVQEVVLDLRYNGGGLVSMGATLASYVAGPGAVGQPYAQLVYSDRQQALNSVHAFSAPASALALSRVYVLTGARTCSAAEQVINGLRPFVDVVAVGDTTCGKPVGFRPQSNGCGITVNAVNFESLNARNEGRYFNGFDATCPVGENFTVALGADADPLLAAARSHAATGACPATGSGKTEPLALKLKAQGVRVNEPGEKPGMVLR
jgi:C-terminal processing protease CtpA/Prc